MVAAAYIIAGVLFILSLGGLSHQETSRRGNLFGMVGMAIAIIATVASEQVSGLGTIIAMMLVGGTIGAIVASRVEMTQMPQLVAIMHSFVGLAAVLVGFSSYLDPTSHLQGADKTIHEVEIYLGVLIGAVTFTGSVIAFGKLQGVIMSKPLLLPARHWLNLAGGLVCIWLGALFVGADSAAAGMIPLIIMTLIAFAFGVHMVMAIGGADMPVVISMLNSYSGWAAAAAGFMLSNDLLIVTGALVGSSGAILSYIMCRAMNRKFINVIMGGFGTTAGGGVDAEAGEVVATSADEVAEMLRNADEVIIVPGYGMAVAHAQHPVSDMTEKLRAKGINVRFAIHPVAGRMPGATGYAGVDNPLFYRDNTRMLFGDAKDSVDHIVKQLVD
jgi:NAD(P) transhydrogenase subunit beta